MIYELRIYDAMPGKLPQLSQRFKDLTLPLFERHGIRSIGYWTTYIGPSVYTLTYMLAWEDLGERQRRWDAFQADPEWQAGRIASEANGPIIERAQSIIMKPTDYSPLQ